MHFKPSYLAPLILLLLSSSSHAQDLSNLPSCAQTPALSAIGSTGCQASDFACLCKDNSFISAALAGAEKQCSQADLQKVLSFAQQICNSVGVSLSVSAQGSTSSVPSTSANTPTPTSAPSTATPTTSTGVLQSASLSSSAKAAATTATSVATGNAGGSATSGAGGGMGLGWRGVVWSGAVVGLCWVGIGA